MYKKFDPINKGNYRPVSFLPLLSEVFEKRIYVQLDEYIENFMRSELLRGFRNVHSTQNALYLVGYVCKIFMDLFKAHDCIIT